jgi:two-component system, OmpR family, sensor histidine kinase KdpD
MGKGHEGFRIKPLVILAVACAFTIAFAIAFESPLELATAVSIYMLLVLAVAWRAGFRGAVILSVCATLCLDFFFTEPLHTLRVISIHDVIALVSFALVSLLVSHLSDQAHYRALQIQMQRDQQQALHELSEQMLLLDWKQDVSKQICDDVRTLCSLNSASLWDQVEDSYASSGERTTNASEALRGFLMAGRDYDAASGQEAVRLLHSGARPIGCIQLRGEKLNPLFMSSIAVLVAATLGRVHALNAEVVAHSEKISERLRASVLDGRMRLRPL